MFIEHLLPAAVRATASFDVAFLVEATHQGHDEVAANALLASLPSGLRAADAWLDELTSLWRYEFGEPWTVLGKPVFGPHCWPLMRNLVGATETACRLLSGNELTRWVGRVDNPINHDAALTEMAPAQRFPQDATVRYEVRTGVGNRDADWWLQRAPYQPVLFDVKRRSADLLHLFGRTVAGERRPNGHAPAPTHDPALLFRSVEAKFLAIDPATRLQGAWVASGLKQEPSGLREAFNKLDAGKVHFAVLGGWGRGALVLSHDPSHARVVLATLGDAAL